MIDVNLKGHALPAAATLPTLIEAVESDFLSLFGSRGPARLPLGSPSTTREVRPARVRHAPSTMSCASTGLRATCICPGGVNTDFALGTGRDEGDRRLEGMPSADEVADVSAVHRPASPEQGITDRKLPPDDGGVLGLVGPSARATKRSRPRRRRSCSGRRRELPAARFAGQLGVRLEERALDGFVASSSARSYAAAATRPSSTWRAGRRARSAGAGSRRGPERVDRPGELPAPSTITQRHRPVELDHPARVGRSRGQA